MQRISLEDIKPGMYLSKPLMSADGTVLLHEGIEIKERYIRYLRNNGITTLFVSDPTVQETVAAEEDFYDAKHRQEMMMTAKSVIKGFRVGEGIQVSRVQHIVGNFIEQLSHHPENMIHLLDIRRKEEYMFSHAINTCILSIMTGLSLDYDENQLYELGLAAMLHDIGKTKFSKNLALQYPNYLNKNTREEYRRHTFYSLEILRENQKISVGVVNACFQHHERWNGSGYPMGLVGNTIYEHAQIISIADVYDRLIAGMPNRRPTPIYYAVAILNKAAGEYFNPTIVDKFNQNVAIYPMGKKVRLNNGQSGLLLGTDIKSKTTPTVRIVASADGQGVNQLIELDLLKNPEIFMVDFEDLYNSYTKAYADTQVYQAR